MNHSAGTTALLLATLVWAPTLHPQQPVDARAAATSLVARVQRADYEGNRAELRRLHGELATLSRSVDDPHLASRVRYWQGFALWRRALNGFNESADFGEQDQDLWQAVGDFEAALRLEPGFVDAKAGAISCLGNLTYLHRKDSTQVQQLVPRFVGLLKEGMATASDNPRLLWVRGPTQWWSPPDLPQSQVRERQAAAVATYKKGLELARRQKGSEPDPLEPSWGEPELLMSLAWAHLNQTAPDPRAAEAYAAEALALVPYWHYVRDILMPQIQAARDQQTR
jgi:hypothetical protein